MGYFIDRRKRKAREGENRAGKETEVAGGRERDGCAGGEGDAEEMRKRRGEEGGGQHMTVSEVHAASCLATSEKPASDKHGLRHATPSTRVGVATIIETSKQEISILRYVCAYTCI